jgi:uncharacterized protein YjaZ
MNLKEFKECFEKLRNNIDKFVNQVDINDEIINAYLDISKQVINELEEQEKELQKYKNEKLLEIWQKHLKENSKYGLSELAKEIEEKLNEYDRKLKEEIEKDEKLREEILKANKRK